MKIIGENIVEHVGELARLSLTDEEKRRAAADMEKILAYMDILNEAEQSGYQCESISGDSVKFDGLSSDGICNGGFSGDSLRRDCVFSDSLRGDNIGSDSIYQNSLRHDIVSEIDCAELLVGAPRLKNNMPVVPETLRQDNIKQ